MTATVVTGDSVFAHPHFIVSPNISDGATHTTIASALASASALSPDVIAIAIKPGTYTEDLDVPPNVNVYAYARSDFISTVLIVGKLTFSQAGGSTFSYIRFQQNGSFNIELSGANTGSHIFYRCFIRYSSNTMVEWTNGNKDLVFDETVTEQGGQGLKYVNQTSGGQFRIKNCTHFNVHTANFVPSTVAAGGTIICSYSTFQTTAWHFTGNSRAQFSFNTCASGVIAFPFFLLEGANTTNDRIRKNFFIGGAGKSVTVNGSRVTEFNGNIVDTSAVIAIDGTGTILTDSIIFTNPVSTITTTSQGKGRLVTGGISFDGNTTALTALPVPETVGGTAQTTYATGDILYASSANTLTKLPIGSNGEVLTIVAGIPAWV